MKNKPLKIIFLEPCPVNFGGYFRANNICYFLAKSGHEVDLLVTSNKKFSLSISRSKILPNYHITELPRFFINKYIQGRFLRAFISIIYCLKKKYDIYHIGMLVEPETSIPAIFLKLIGKKNIVMDWDELYLNGASDTHPLLHWYIKLCETKFPKNFPNFCVTSDTLEKIAKSNGSKNIIKIINAVNTEQVESYDHKLARKKLNLDQDLIYLLTFGNSFIGKRVGLLFNYIESVVKIDHKVRILVNFDPISVLKSNGYHNKVNPTTLSRIINVGYIKNSDLGHYLSAVDATIFLAEDSDIERANFPIRIGTYLAGGSIIITNDIDSEANMVLKNHHCAIIDKDISNLADKSIKILKDQKQVQTLKKNIKIAQQRLSYSTIIQDLINYYYQINSPTIKHSKS